MRSNLRIPGLLTARDRRVGFHLLAKTEPPFMQFTDFPVPKAPTNPKFPPEMNLINKKELNI